MANLTEAQVNELARVCVLSQYGSEDHEEYDTALNACIIGINEGLSVAAKWAMSQDQWVAVQKENERLRSEIDKLIILQERSSARYKACFGDVNPEGHQIFDLFAKQLKHLQSPPKKGADHE